MRLIAVLAAMLRCAGPRPPKPAIANRSPIPPQGLPAITRPRRPAARSPTRPQASSADSGKNVDAIGDEDAVVNAKLHGICRGC